MTIKEIIIALGGVRYVSRQLGLRKSTVRGYIHEGAIPPAHHGVVIALGKEKGIHLTPADLEENDA